MEKLYPFSYLFIRIGYYQLALTHYELSKIEITTTKKIDFLKKASDAMEKSIRVFEKKRLIVISDWTTGLLGQYYLRLGVILQKLSFLEKDEKLFNKSKKIFSEANLALKKAKMPSYIAESYWHIAQLQTP